MSLQTVLDHPALATVLDSPLLTAVAITALTGLGFVAVGLGHDFLRWRTGRRTDRIHADLAIVLFHGDEEAAEASERLTGAPRQLVLGLVQRLSSELSGDAPDRLRNVVGAAALDRHIRRRLKSRTWRRRAQGAGLANLLPAHDPMRTALLDDPHPLVRARTAEAMDRGDVETRADRLIALLDDDVDAVKFAAQSALLHGGERVIDVLEEYLASGEGDGIEWALEVAANLPNPQLVPGMTAHLDSPEPRRRAIATRAVAPWLSELEPLIRRLDDDDPLVRATAAEAVGVIGAETLAARVGRLLTDQSWLVREHAGRALAAMGPTGVMTLRIHLDDPDPYAQDMARQVLDTLDASRHHGMRRVA